VALLEALDARVLYELGRQTCRSPRVPRRSCGSLRRLGLPDGGDLGRLLGGGGGAAEAAGDRPSPGSNTLEIEGGKLTGRVVGPNRQRAAQGGHPGGAGAAGENVPLDQVIAIGDGANDLLIAAVRRGTGVPSTPSPSCGRRRTTSNLRHGARRPSSYLLGITGRDVASLEARDEHFPQETPRHRRPPPAALAARQLSAAASGVAPGCGLVVQRPEGGGACGPLACGRARTRIDAAIAGVNLVEDDPNDNDRAGTARVPNEEGVVQLDASSDARARRRGRALVAALEGVQNPTKSRPKLVMEYHRPTCSWSGPGARHFA